MSESKPTTRAETRMSAILSPSLKRRGGQDDDGARLEQEKRDRQVEQHRERIYADRAASKTDPRRR